MTASDPQSPRHKRRIVSAFMILIWIVQLIPVYGWAEEKPKVAIVGFRAGEGEQDLKVRKTLTYRLRSLGLKDDVLVTSTLQSQISGISDPKSKAVVSKAYEHFNAGLQFYHKLDLTNALKEFNASVKGYREGISILKDNYYLLFSHLYLGIILNFLGREDEGKKFIREMVKLDSERSTRVLSQRDFPPKIVALHKQVTQDVLANPISTLNVDSEPSGAKVVFNGLELGKTPYQIQNIPSGQHFLSLELSGYQYFGSPIQIDPGAQNFTTMLKEKSFFNVYQASARTDSAKIELEKLAQALDVDVLVLGQASRKDDAATLVQTQIFDVRSNEFSDVFEEVVKTKQPKFQNTPSKIISAIESPETSAVAMNSSNNLKEKIDENITSNQGNTKTLEDESLNSRGSEDNLGTFREKKSIKNSSKPIYKRWWFWTLLGAAAGGGAYYYYFMQDKDATSNIITIPNPL